MRCFYVLVHGSLVWHSLKLATDVIGADRPDGFWCHRFVLADDEKAAENKAYRRVTAFASLRRRCVPPKRWASAAVLRDQPNLRMTSAPWRVALS
jgi:hypothetical protein